MHLAVRTEDVDVGSGKSSELTLTNKKVIGEVRGEVLEGRRWSSRWTRSEVSNTSSRDLSRQWESITLTASFVRSFLVCMTSQIII